MVCVFFGHRDCRDLSEKTLIDAVEALIMQGADIFYVGHQGGFDSMARRCLQLLKTRYPQIRYAVVLSHPSAGGEPIAETEENTVFPEGLETVPPRYAVDRRNKWMLDRADCCVCYVNHSYGGAYKFASRAKRKGLVTVNLGTAELP